MSADTKRCPFCAETIKAEAAKCRYCGEMLTGDTAKWMAFRAQYDAMSGGQQLAAWARLSKEQRAFLGGRHPPSAVGPATPSKSDGLAFLLRLLLGPVGLWYKGNWAAGFAWLVMGLLVGLATGFVGFVLAPFFWLGMAIHAAVAKSKG